MKRLKCPFISYQISSPLSFRPLTCMWGSHDSIIYDLTSPLPSSPCRFFSNLEPPPTKYDQHLTVPINTGTGLSGGAGSPPSRGVTYQLVGGGGGPAELKSLPWTRSWIHTQRARRRTSSLPPSLYHRRPPPPPLPFGGPHRARGQREAPCIADRWCCLRTRQRPLGGGRGGGWCRRASSARTTSHRDGDDRGGDGVGGLPIL
jgi:hypothetical protein